MALRAASALATPVAEVQAKARRPWGWGLCDALQRPDRGEEGVRLRLVALRGHADVLQGMCGGGGRRWRGGDVPQEGRG